MVAAPHGLSSAGSGEENRASCVRAFIRTSLSLFSHVLPSISCSSPFFPCRNGEVNSLEAPLKMHLTLEFGGGLELLCQSVKIHNIDVDLKAGEEKLTMRDLLSWVRTNLIKERPEMFMKGDSVRPGVLVLVNDCDWELSGQLDTTLEEKDVVYGGDGALVRDPIQHCGA